MTFSACFALLRLLCCICSAASALLHLLCCIACRRLKYLQQSKGSPKAGQILGLRYASDLHLHKPAPAQTVWALQGLNLRPLPCQGSALPLS
jgi:hypothetical protein